MIRTFGLKTSYSPIIKMNEGVYKLCWDYEDFKNLIYEELTPEEKAKEEVGEFVERTVIDYEDTDYCTYVYEILPSKTLDVQDIRNIITKYYNSQTDYKILTGFVWNEMPVWLSSENQFNYKAAYDLAVQTNGASLPVTFKFGTTNNPVYHTFTTVEELADFYTKAIEYVNKTLADGWAKKDSIDWTVYENALNPKSE